MKKIFAVVLTVALILAVCPLGLFSVNASAESSGYYTYSVSNGKATITNVDTSISGNVTIPSTLGGYPVTSIGGDAFGGCTGLTSVTIPDSVTSIGACVFYDCTGLTSVTIGNGVRSIGSGAFDGCTGLTEVYITDLAAWCKTNFALAYYGPANPLEYAEKLYIDGVAATDITIPDSVTSIGDRAFMGYAGLTSVTIPDSVTSIGGDAFRGCTGLEKITVDSRNTVYHSSGNCLIETATKTLVMGCKNSVIPTDGSVTSIGKCAFYDCTGLTTVTIGNSVTSIGDSAFMGCTGLSSVTIPDSVTSIGDEAFEYCTGLTSITIPDSVTSIGDCAFEYCTGLTSVTIPNSVEYIGDSAFYHTEITEIITDGVFSSGFQIWPENLEKLNITDLSAYCETDRIYEAGSPFCFGGVKLYVDDRLVEHLVIPDGVTKIGDYAFDGFDLLKTIIVPESVTSIGYNAFYGCTGLEKITVDSKNTVYHSSGNCLIETETKTLVMGCKNSVIPTDGSVTSIGDEAFEYCTGLTSITIPDSVTSIGDCAFEYCTGLTSVSIGNGVTSIGDWAFYGCTGLEKITVDSKNTVYHSSGNCLIETATKTLVMGCKNSVIPNGVKSIGNYAFSRCTGLTSITIPDSVTSIGNWAFDCCFGLKDVYYRGSGSDKSKISIGSENTNLTSATWHYNSCIGSATHNYILNGNLTCSGCKESKAPAAPTLSSKTDTTITLTTISGMEYSKNGTTWQGSPVFTGLSPNTTYTFYQRVAEADDTHASEKSAGLSVTTLKSIVSAPSAPTVASKTDTTVTLTAVSGMEYSKDGVNWQSSNVFAGLTSGATYTFYQRVTETDTAYASAISPALSVATKLISYIEIESTITKTTYIEGEGLNPAGGKIKVHFTDGTWQTEDITLDMISGFNSMLRGKQTVTVTRTGKTTTMNVWVVGPVRSITICSEPWVTVYIKGREDLNVDGGQLEIEYRNGSYDYVDITPDMVSGFDKNKLGKQTLAVTFDGLTAYYEVEVIEYVSKFNAIVDVSTHVGQAVPMGVEATFEVTPSTADADRLFMGFAWMVSSDGVVFELCRQGDVFEAGKYYALVNNIGSLEGIDDDTVWMLNGKPLELLEIGYDFGDGITFSEDAVFISEKLKAYTPGDLDDNDDVTDRDAVHLLYHTFLPDLYPVNQDCDFNNDGSVNDKDAVYLLYHTFLPDLYPLN